MTVAIHENIEHIVTFWGKFATGMCSVMGPSRELPGNPGILGQGWGVG